MTGLGFPNDMKPFVAGRHLPGLRPVERPGPRLPRRTGRGQARQRRDHGHRRRDLHGARASTTTSRTRSARTASSSSGRPSGSTRRTSTTSTSRLAAPRRDASGPGGARFRGSVDSGGGAMERVGFTMRLLPGPGGRVPPPARRRLAGDARRAQGGRRPRLLDLHPRRRTCSPISRSTTSRRSGRRMAASRGQRPLAGRDGRADRPADRPRDRVPPASRGDLPPRLSGCGPGNARPVGRATAAGPSSGR